VFATFFSLSYSEASPHVLKPGSSHHGKKANNLLPSISIDKRVAKTARHVDPFSIKPTVPLRLNRSGRITASSLSTMTISRRSSHSKGALAYTYEEKSIEGDATPPRSLTSKSTLSDLSTVIIPTPQRRPLKATWRRFFPEKFIRFGWWWEAGAMLLAIGCISSIVAILFYMNGKPMLDWKLPIQPNSLVSVFSTVGKSALLFAVSEGLGQLKWVYFEEPRALSQMENFDQASRGPWGAFTFLWHTRGTAFIASMGAFATVLMLAFEPVTQQVIEFSTRVSLQSNQTGWYSTAYAWSNSSSNDTRDLPSSTYGEPSSNVAIVALWLRELTT
jgi:hypothetical protein